MPVHRPAGPLRDPYLALTRLAKNDLGTAATSRQLLDLVLVSLRFLASKCISVDLISCVPGKDYFSFALKSNPKLLSRPINKKFFLPSERTIAQQWSQLEAGSINGDTLSKLLYTMAVAYCAGIDLFDRNNKKGPATYFECLIGHLFARELRVNPTKRATLPTISGRSVRLTMDFLFDLGEARPKLHLPVKMSTRERVVQAWSHQRLLDAAFGHGSYRGILVIHSETKLDLQTREVVEICVPDQWLAYQTLLAKMDRIYFFDVPGRYQALTEAFPDVIQIKPFSDFFSEREEVLFARILPT